MRALEHVDDPELGRSVVELGMVRNVEVDDGNVFHHDLADDVRLSTQGQLPFPDR